jgi:hypothetical protein
MRWWTVGGMRMGFALLSAAAALAVPARSASALQWIDGSPAYTYHNECITGNVEALTGQYVGYFGLANATFPQLGDVYYAHVVVSTLGNACVGNYVHIEVAPPPATTFVIHPSYPVFCYYTSPQNVTSQITVGCPQAPGGGGIYGGVFDSTDPQFPGPWPLAQGAFIEIQFPVRSTRKLNGTFDNPQSLLYGAVRAIDGGGNPWAFPTEGQFVSDANFMFKDNFETGNLAGWGTTATDGGDLAPSGSAAIYGSWGLRALVDDTAGIYAQDDRPSLESRYQARFYFNPNSFDPGEANSFFRTRIFIAFQATPQQRNLTLVLKRQGGQYAVQVRVRLNNGTLFSSPFVNISNATHLIEMDWRRATTAGGTNGTVHFYIDNSLTFVISGLANGSTPIDFARLGAMSVKTGAAGTMYFDEFEDWR